jgi:hypothetical protein
MLAWLNGDAQKRGVNQHAGNGPHGEASVARQTDLTE